MAFTAGELTSIAASALDYYFNRGELFKQTIQAKPLLKKMEAKKKSFPGGKGKISLGVLGVFGAGGTNDGVAGYTHDDSVNFYTPANNQRAEYTWREHHIGLTLTHTEMKIDGISVTDDMGNGSSMSRHSDRDMTVLANLLDTKLFDLGEQYARTMNALMWGDGTGDAKALAGMRHLIAANPTTGIVGGLDRATYTWWRNRARTAAHAGAGGTGAVTSSTANGGALIEVLQIEHRQLIRYGGRPDTFLAGSDFIGALEKELRANGYYSQTGFTEGADVAVGGIKFNGITVEYDPTLDDLSLAKRAYWFDSNAIGLFAMEGEWRKQHTPARPNNKFVMYRSITSTGQMVGRQFNSSLVIDIV